MEKIEAPNNQNRDGKEENDNFSLFSNLESNETNPYENMELNPETFANCKNNEEIFSLLYKMAYTKEHEEKFKKFFFEAEEEKNEMQSKEFTAVGIFEDISYLSFWLNNTSFSVFTNNIKETAGINYWKRIKGDGNCYYRAVLINYMELLIVNSYEKKNPEIFFSLIKDIIFTEFPKDKERFKKLSMTVFIVMYECLTSSLNERAENINSLNSENTLKKTKIYECFDILYRAYNKSDIIEKMLILWVRLKLTNFLKKNLDLEFHGLKLVQCIPGFELEDDLSYDKNAVFKYIDNELSKMNEFVEGYPLYITPLILKVDVNIYFIDERYNPLKIDLKYYGDINQNITPIENFLYDLTNPEFENEINVLFQVPHYDTLYKSTFVDKINSFYPNPDSIIIEGQMTEAEYDQYKTETLNYIRAFRRKNNPLAQILDGQEVRPSFNNPQQETHIVIDFNNLNLNDDNRGVRNFKPENNTKPSTQCICVMCFKESETLIYYPCKHSFCLSCFESYFNSYLNSKTKKIKHKIKDIKKIDEILNILKYENKFKFIKCLNCDCVKQFQYYDLEKIVEDFFYYSSGGKPKKIITKQPEEKESNSAYCKPCQTYTDLIQLSDGCEVCIDCQKKSIFKENGRQVSMVYDRSRLKPNKCLKCKKNLKSNDYEIVFKGNMNRYNLK